MIDIPLGKALVPVENVGKKKDCKDCDALWACDRLACTNCDREDGKDVIFKLVDFPEGGEP